MSTNQLNQQVLWKERALRFSQNGERQLQYTVLSKLFPFFCFLFEETGQNAVSMKVLLLKYTLLFIHSLKDIFSMRASFFRVISVAELVKFLCPLKDIVKKRALVGTVFIHALSNKNKKQTDQAYRLIAYREVLEMQ